MKEIGLYFLVSWLLAAGAGFAFSAFRKDLAKFNRVSLFIAYGGAVILGFGVWAWLLRSSDYGWWPLIVSLYGAAWITFVLVIAACVRHR